MPWISQEHQSYIQKLSKIRKMTPSLTVKMEFSKNVKILQCLMLQGSLNPNMTFLGEKL